MSATSEAIKMWSLVYVDQGLTVQNGLLLGFNSPTNLDVWVEKTSVDQNENITTTTSHRQQHNNNHATKTYQQLHNINNSCKINITTTAH